MKSRISRRFAFCRDGRNAATAVRAVPTRAFLSNSPTTVIDMQYNVGDHVRCMWGLKPVEYEAKILHTNSATKEYFVHYQGWNKRYDEWISERSILGISKKSSTVVCDTPKTRQSKREKKTRKPLDWSPTPTSSRVAEKPVSVKADCKKLIGPVRVTKYKRSPILKTSKQSRLQVSTVANDSTEESVTSDDDDADCTQFPRSYIDTLVKQKKREERKRQKRSSPKLPGVDLIKTWKLSLPRNSSDTLTATLLPIMDVGKSSTMPPMVPRIPVECHSFSNIEADHNYSSLTFHYSDAYSLNAIREQSHASQLKSSTKRMNILPLRKPLNVQYRMPCSTTLKLYTEALSMSFKNRHGLGNPSNLGAPFSYDDEYHSSLGTPIECNNEIDVSSLSNKHVSDSGTTSSSSSESGECSIGHTALTQKSVSAFTIAT
ncbi:hypothetical protein DICVIV_08918 [Dictyocaulus viviparus]|uniref:Chromo domain-containing protein n=1 Tax=Dictyocaulus viviparus TaxID=29172 RepID=A0A0D8XKE6_DICVI|nr:hypothetical protein DICVIV_08918 [Dictyocaulus viviparus]